MGKDREPRDPPEWDDDPDVHVKWFDIAGRAAAKLPDIAKIPPEQREAFCKHAAVIIAETQFGIFWRATLLRHFQEGEQGGAAIFKEIEQAAVDLYRAVEKLTIAELHFLQAKIDTVGSSLKHISPPPPQLSLAAVPILAFACSMLVGKNPYRSGQEGNVIDWEFQRLVYALWRCARKHGGNLNASKREGKFFGAMFKAIDVVRQHIVHDRVPSIFKPSQKATVVDIVTNAKKGIRPGIRMTAQYPSIFKRNR
jgi:hypothetical protein